MKNKSYKINIWLKAMFILQQKLKFSLPYFLFHIILEFMTFAMRIDIHKILFILSKCFQSHSIMRFFFSFHFLSSSFVFNIRMRVSGNKTTTMASPLSHSFNIYEVAWWAKHSVICWRRHTGHTVPFLRVCTVQLTCNIK